jgi:ATP-dependent DNA helicase RecQ
VEDVAGDLAGAHLKVCLKLLKDAKLLRQNRKLAYNVTAQAPKDSLFEAMAEVYRRKQEHDKEALEQMVGYAVSGFCRWKLLLDYFGDEVEGFEKCCRCDNCLNPPAAVLLDDIEIRDDEFDREPEPEARSCVVVRAGARVKVPKYGEGVVAAVAGDQVTIDFPDGEQRSFLGFRQHA